jgi:hypothetical protein
MKAVVILLSIVLFIACLVLGIQAGNASISPISQTSSTGSTQNSPAGLIQRTVVLVGIDDLSSPDPSLTSVWLVIYRSDLPKFTLYSLYPAVSAPDGINLADSFAFQPDGSLSQTFLDQINAYHFAWDGYLVIDRSGVSQFVDWIGGTALGNGESITNLLYQTSDNSQTMIDTHNQVGKAICDRLSQVPSNIDWSSLWTTLISGHIRSTLGFERLNDDWQRLTAINGAISCEFP